MLSSKIVLWLIGSWVVFIFYRIVAL